jgi:hypothetical protein
MIRCTFSANRLEKRLEKKGMIDSNGIIDLTNKLYIGF